MRLSSILLVLLLGLCILLSILVFSARIEGVTGSPHPRYETMVVSLERGEQPTSLLVLGWTFGILQIALFTILMAIGVRHKKYPRWALPTSMGLAMATLTAVVVSSAASRPATDGLFLSLPPATAWMFFAMWPVPLVFVVLFCLCFESMVVTREDLDTFEAILARQENQQEPDRT